MYVVFILVLTNTLNNIPFLFALAVDGNKRLYATINVQGVVLDDGCVGSASDTIEHMKGSLLHW